MWRKIMEFPNSYWNNKILWYFLILNLKLNEIQYDRK